MPLPFITADEVRQRVPMLAAVDAIEQALRDGLDPSKSPARNSVPLDQGSFLLMPAETPTAAGMKVASVAPANPAAGLPKIQGLYLLFDANTLEPTAVLEGSSLTEIRTPALSAVGVRHLAPQRGHACDGLDVILFGTGPQAFNHVHATAAVRPINSVTVLGRRQEKVDDLVTRLTQDGFSAVAGTDPAEHIPSADLVLCCTSAREPLFDGSLVRDDALVVAMGSHEPDARETDDVLLSRATVYVEDVDTAMREAGDVRIAVDNGTLGTDDLHTLSELVNDGPVDAPGPVFLKTVGMGWQDLAVTEVAYRAEGN
ncbi:ornithine cyclodeaminase family protein [Corynebacterium sp. AOP40-9SA-29]|uniref:ornithine cyclodeaminase family protein n=1 Tax=Corynebacterium sp. AOP40-9SA-29 TaxID=3457677 RepID=UPI0040336BB8